MTENTNKINKNLLRLKDLYTHLLEPVDTHAATVGDSFIHLRLIKAYKAHISSDKHLNSCINYS